MSSVLPAGAAARNARVPVLVLVVSVLAMWCVQVVVEVLAAWSRSGELESILQSVGTLAGLVGVGVACAVLWPARDRIGSMAVVLVFAVALLIPGVYLDQVIASSTATNAVRWFAVWTVAAVVLGVWAWLLAQDADGGRLTVRVLTATVAVSAVAVASVKAFTPVYLAIWLPALCIVAGLLSASWNKRIRWNRPVFTPTLRAGQW